MPKSQKPLQYLPPRSVHTDNFPQLLTQLGCSLLISTYQAGKLVIVRADDTQLNNHFRLFNQPMGIAANGSRLIVGTAYDILELRNVPAVARKLEPIGKHDACYLPRNSHTTGDIDIHEMALGNGGLWFVNTCFSCLCTLDREHSFVPRWRPPFVSALTPDDCCHLNGLAMVEGQPKYVTALGATDTAAGWRENRDKGGVLIDVEHNEVLVQGLSMPHSPRWYAGKLWLLESGYGSLATVDLATGKPETVIRLPGFTRGLDFYGSLAFIGLSQVRDTNMLSGIPLEERSGGRVCGVWVVHLETGNVVAFLQFEQGVEEIFAVQVLPGIRYPEVTEWMVDWDENLVGRSYILPTETLKDVPQV